jgi:hypothetical protein
MDDRSMLDIHVFMLANVLRRPIVVYAAPSMLQCQAGIYLPLLHKPDRCCNVPLTLLYEEPQPGKAAVGHFNAVLGVEGLTRRVPLYMAVAAEGGLGSSPGTEAVNQRQQLPIRFQSAAEMEGEWCTVVGTYLELTPVDIDHGE